MSSNEVLDIKFVDEPLVVKEEEEAFAEVEQVETPITFAPPLVPVTPPPVTTTTPKPKEIPKPPVSKPPAIVELEEEDIYYEVNSYGDFVMPYTHIAQDIDVFIDYCETVIKKAIDRRAPVVWVQLLDQHVEHFSVALRMGFATYSVYRPPGGLKYTQMSMSLTADIASIVPESHHTIKVAILIVDENNDKILCIRGKSSKNQRMNLLTGFLRPKEYILEAAARIASEEANLAVLPIGIGGFWQCRYGPNYMSIMEFGVVAVLEGDAGDLRSRRAHAIEMGWVDAENFKLMFGNSPEFCLYQAAPHFEARPLANRKYKSWVLYAGIPFDEQGSAWEDTELGDDFENLKEKK